MHTQHGTYTRPRSSDFSSAMMRASVADRAMPQSKKHGDYTTGRQQQKQPDSYSNRNLSSIISRITDDGPANLQVEQDVNHIKNTHKRNPVQPAQGAGDRSKATVTPDDQYLFAQSFAFDDPGIRDNPQSWNAKKSFLWHQTVLIALCSVIAVMGYFLFQLKMQTEDMKQALDSSQEQILLANSVQSAPPDILPRLSSMNKALTELKQELHGIKLGYQQSDNKLAMDIPRDLEPRLLEIAAASEIVTVLQDEFERIQHDMQKMGSELKVIRNGITPVQDPVALVEAGPEQIQNTPNLIVNLASLASKDKAQAAIEKLQQAGVSPRMQQVMVNGKIVFRISVDGFSTRDAAFAFIAEAKNKYGFEGGWIRPI